MEGSTAGSGAGLMRQQWEYKRDRVTLEGEALEVWLGFCGLEGWELAAATPGTFGAVWYIFKRPTVSITTTPAPTYETRDDD